MAKVKNQGKELSSGEPSGVKKAGGGENHEGTSKRHRRIFSHQLSKAFTHGEQVMAELSWVWRFLLFF